MSASPIPTSAPADVEKVAIREIVTAPAWTDIKHRDHFLEYLQEKLVLDVFRKGFGLTSAPVRKVREMVWGHPGEGFREPLSFERPEVYEVTYTARAVRLQ